MEFAALLKRFTDAVEAGDGAALATCFTEDGVYHDYIYGAFQGRSKIAEMLEGYFHRDATDFKWDMLDPVSDGKAGYARYLFSFTSTMPAYKGRHVVIEGMARYVLRDGLIADYSEAINGGIAMAQLGVEPERMARTFRRWADEVLSKPENESHLRD